MPDRGVHLDPRRLDLALALGELLGARDDAVGGVLQPDRVERLDTLGLLEGPAWRPVVVGGRWSVVVSGQ